MVMTQFKYTTIKCQGDQYVNINFVIDAQCFCFVFQIRFQWVHCCIETMWVKETCKPCRCITNVFKIAQNIHYTEHIHSCLHHSSQINTCLHYLLRSISQPLEMYKNRTMYCERFSPVRSISGVFASEENKNDQPHVRMFISAQ